MKKVKKYGTHFPQNKSAILKPKSGSGSINSISCLSMRIRIRNDGLYTETRRGMHLTLTTEIINDSTVGNDPKEMKFL